jgi:hypothetical protein
LGEGAEIDLYQALKVEFGEGKIERINKGQPGADSRAIEKRAERGLPISTRRQLPAAAEQLFRRFEGLPASAEVAVAC